MHDLQHQSDHDLLAAGRDEVIAENRAAASRSQRLVALFRRHRAEEDTDDPTQLTARDYVAVEVSELWAIPSAGVQSRSGRRMRSLSTKPVVMFAPRPSAARNNSSIAPEKCDPNTSAAVVPLRVSPSRNWAATARA